MMFEEVEMNKDQIEGAARDFGGRVQRGVGKLMRSPEQQIRGIENQAEGRAKRERGNLEATVKHMAQR